MNGRSSTAAGTLDAAGGSANTRAPGARCLTRVRRHCSAPPRLSHQSRPALTALPPRTYPRSSAPELARFPGSPQRHPSRSASLRPVRVGPACTVRRARGHGSTYRTPWPPPRCETGASDGVPWCHASGPHSRPSRTCSSSASPPWLFYGWTGAEIEKAPLSRAFSMRPNGLEPSRGNLPTRPSTSSGRVRCVRGRPQQAICARPRRPRTHLARRLFSRCSHGTTSDGQDVLERQR